MRRILTQLAAAAFLALPLLLVVAAGVAFLTPPATPATQWLPVSSMSMLPEDGQPVRLRLTAPHYDAWTKLADQRVGDVFARRLPGTDQVHVVNAYRGRFGDPVSYDAQARCYQSDCFYLRFDMNGKFIPDERVKPSQVENLTEVPARIVGDSLLVQWTSR